MTEEEPAQNDADGAPSDRVTWREPIAAFFGVVIALVAASALSWVWPLFADYLLVVAAGIFIAVPYWILRRRGADFHRFGIDLEHIPLKQVGLGLLVTAVVLPFFAVGYHVWESSVQERDFEPDIDNYRQWPVELQAPSLLSERSEAIQLRTFSNQLHLEWTQAGRPATTVLVESDRPFRWRLSGDLSATDADDGWFDESADPIPSPPARARGVDLAPHARWIIVPTGADATGRLTIAAPEQLGNAQVPNALELRLFTMEDAVPPEVFVGSAAHSPQEPIEIRRTHWWLLLWALTHLLLVAFPEEYFYRGYLQTRLADLFGDGDGGDPRTFLGFSRANWLTSGFFALGHVLIPIGGTFSLARASVFFPSLLFGWLRERTGSIIAPTVFHAGANMMVLVVAVHYF